MSSCPTPSKTSYRSKNTAIGGAIFLSGKTGRRVRIYHFPCGKWHMTTKRWAK